MLAVLLWESKICSLMKGDVWWCEIWLSVLKSDVCLLCKVAVVKGDICSYVKLNILEDKVFSLVCD